MHEASKTRSTNQTASFHACSRFHRPHNTAPRQCGPSVNSSGQAASRISFSESGTSSLGATSMHTSTHN